MSRSLIKVFKGNTNEWTHRKMGLKPCNQNQSHSTPPLINNCTYIYIEDNSSDLHAYMARQL